MPKALDWKAGIWAGIIAGLAYVMIAMGLVVTVMGMSPWGPPRMMAAIVMGQSVLPPMGEAASFDFGIVMIGMMVHLVLSIVLAIVLGWGISRFGLGMAAAIIVGMIFGIIVYYVDFYGFTAVFPWFAMNRSLSILFSHAMFGAVAGGVYRAIARHDAKNAAEGARSAARA